MAFDPEPGQELRLDGTIYRVAGHPGAPGIPYGQEGRQATVYQLIAGEEPTALKVFKPRFRVPGLVYLAERLGTFSALPGLSVCRRTVLNARQHGDLLRQHPDLAYAVLMPWIEGPTWMEVVGTRRPLRANDALELARSLASTLAGMEERGVAHCDLSGPNLLLPGLVDGGGGIALVDVEQLYAPGLEQPAMLPGTSPGYGHGVAEEARWRAEADRFSGAVLLAELLAWCDEGVRSAAWGESYFDPAEMQRDSPRARRLVAALEASWGENTALLFERAWRSATLADCPTFAEWLVTLPADAASGQQPSQRQASRRAAGEDAGLAVARALLDVAQRLEDQNNLAGALENYRAAARLAPEGAGLRERALARARTVEQSLSNQAEAWRTTQEAPPSGQAPVSATHISSGAQLLMGQVATPPPPAPAATDTIDWANWWLKWTLSTCAALIVVAALPILLGIASRELQSSRAAIWYFFVGTIAIALPQGWLLRPISRRASSLFTAAQVGISTAIIIFLLAALMDGRSDDTDVVANIGIALFLISVVQWWVLRRWLRPAWPLFLSYIIGIPRPADHVHKRDRTVLSHQ